MKNETFFDKVEQALAENQKLIDRAGKLIDQGKVEEGTHLLKNALANNKTIGEILSKAKP